jgi:hypothetical protein
MKGLHAMKQFAILSVLCLSGCANVSVPPTVAEEIERSIANATPPPSPAIPVKPTVATKANTLLARAAAKQMLKDPESARFSLEIQHAEAVCGFVNSKNSYGGYVGESPYIYVNATRDVFILQHGGSDDQRIALLKKLNYYCPS